MLKQPSKKYERICPVYEYFASSFDVDLSDEAKVRFYNYETFGTPIVKYYEPYNGMFNGYAVGKHWMDVNMAMYKEDLLARNLTKFEIYSDPDVPQVVKDWISDFPI